MQVRIVRTIVVGLEPEEARHCVLRPRLFICAGDCQRTVVVEEHLFEVIEFVHPGAVVCCQQCAQRKAEIAQRDAAREQYLHACRN